MSRSLLERLRTLEQSVGKTNPAKSNMSDEADNSQQELTSSEAGPSSAEEQLVQAGFETLETPYGACWRRKTSFDLFTRHGHDLFADVLYTDFTALSKLAAAKIEVDNLRFYDVETNGLGTGAGTFPFLHTVGYVIEDEFCLMQYFVDDYDAEAAILFALAENHFAGDVIVVTFNGKSFDWPLLQNRRVMHQFDRLEHSHLDLLHPSRRLFKNQIPSVKLAQLEQSILGVVRTDDLPGSEAPERYFRYLEERNIAVMEPVFGHNALDVCSLVTLQMEIARLLNGERTNLPARTHLALASWYDAWHDVQAAAHSYEAASRAEDADWQSHWLYSLFLKRRRDDEGACLIWREMAEAFPKQVEPLIELAKCYEHRQRDLERAEAVVIEAIRRLTGSEHKGVHIPHRVGQRSVEAVSTEESPLTQALRHRLARIRRKQARL